MPKTFYIYKASVDKRPCLAIGGHVPLGKRALFSGSFEECMMFVEKNMERERQANDPAQMELGLDGPQES